MVDWDVDRPRGGVTLSASLVLRSRAAHTLVLFMTSTMISLVLLAPQPVAAVGCQLLVLVLAVVSGVGLFLLGRRAGQTLQPQIAGYVERISVIVRARVAAFTG